MTKPLRRQEHEWGETILPGASGSCCDIFVTIVERIVIVLLT